MSERKSRNIFVLMWLSLVVILMTMNSCGSSKEFHVGTGKELSKSRCTGNYIGR